ncbi:aromatic amino acid ammonia-lyase [Plantibacter flavus]|uniref:aromatic amino acid ammonia-lyase n=1 Tax=Plantibacter flavus TaxID=150123 RepID=UPI003F18D493
MGAPVVFGAGPIGVDDLVAVAAGRAIVVLDTAALDRIGAARAIVERHLVGAASGGGAGRRSSIDPGHGPGQSAEDGTDQADVQRRLVNDHRGGVGHPLSEERARAVIAARLAGWTRGGSGIRLETAVFTAELLNRGVVPVIPSIGSVGDADPTHLAAFAALATGSGDALLGGEQLPSAAALARVGLVPLELAQHEGVALVNHNSYTLGVGALVLDRLAALSRIADTTAALSVRALEGFGVGGAAAAFDPVVLAHSPSLGAIESGARLTELLGEPTRGAHGASARLPLAVRATPQANGALVDQLASAVVLLEATLGSAAENPLVDQPSGTVHAGALFHIAPLAHALDGLRAVVAQVSTAADRRIAAVSDVGAERRRRGRNRIPGLLRNAAADLLAELRVLATPVAIGGTVLGGGGEDIASFAGTALRLLERSTALHADVLAIEALIAVDALATAPSRVSTDELDAIRAALDVIVEEAPRGQQLITATLATLGVERS